MNTHTVLEWQGHEHEHGERKTDWFWAVGIVAVGVAVVSILLGNLLFAILVIIAAIGLVIQVMKEPRVFRFGIAERGIIIGERLYPYSTLESFWVENTEHEQVLLIKSNRFFMPYLVLPLTGVHPELVRGYLLEVLEEEELHEPLSQKIMEYFGF